MPQPDEILRELGHIVASAAFRDLLHLKRFLTFIVEATLAGNVSSIKAYTVAIEALGRGSDFDPQRDPIVRVEAGRLRQALARYYAGAGRDDLLRIDVPRGTYVPVFRRPDNAKTAPPASPLADYSAPGGDATRGLQIAARPCEPEMLHAEVQQQARDLIAQIQTSQCILSEARALLRQLSDIARPREPASSPPAAPSVVLVAAIATNGKREEEVRNPALRQPLPEPCAAPARRNVCALLALGNNHFGAHARLLLIALSIIGILSVLEVAFDSGRPLAGGANTGSVSEARPPRAPPVP